MGAERGIMGYIEQTDVGNVYVTDINDWFATLSNLNRECKTYTDSEIRFKEILVEHDAKIREEVIEECIKFIKEHSGEHYIDCDGYFGGQLELVFNVDDWIDEMEQLKENKNE